MRSKPVALLSVLALIAACGSGEDSAFEDPAGNGLTGDDGANGGSLGNGNSGGEGTDPSANTGDPNKCAAGQAPVDRKAVKLVLVLDQSGSMGDGTNGIKAEKWDPVTAALKAFLEDPASEGIQANLRLFPKAGATTADKCKTSSYATANVGFTSLPGESAALVSAWPGTPTESSTPTRFVLAAAVTDAKAVAAANPDAKTAIVLITDGEPAGCPDSNKDNKVADVANVVKGTKSTIPTYVIGVGTSTTNLDTIAEAGGPRKAFVVTTGPGGADKTRTEFLAAVDEIRANSISCNVTIPPPPAGQTFDPAKVNVNYTPDGKPTELLSYDESCTEGGWRYDDKAAPKEVVLCEKTCALAKKDPKAKLAVEFGCVTRSTGVR